MGFLDFNVGDVPDIQLLDAGQEVTARIHNLELIANKAGDGKNIHVTLLLPEHPNASYIDTWMPCPKAEDGEKQVNDKKRRIKTFQDCFGLDFDSMNDCSEGIGSEGSIIVGIENDEVRGGQRNRVLRWVIPA